MTGKTETMWERFFALNAERYDEEPYTGDTTGEVSFIIEELTLPTGCHVLDVGCGTGRHSLELARRGYRVTGVDLSEAMLLEAERKADESGTAAEFIRADATVFRRDGAFDDAISLCEGALCLLARNALGRTQRPPREKDPSPRPTLNATNNS